MALQKYARIRVFFDGIELTQLTSADMQTDGGKQRVDLMNEGLGGYTPGSGSVTVSLGFAVPLSGTEYPFQQRAANQDTLVDCQIVVGDDQYIGSGWINTTGISGSANASTEGTCEWLGELKEFGT